MSKAPKQSSKKDKVNKFIDGFIKALKIAGSSDLFLGIFIILEGICLIALPALFPVCIVISIMVSFAFAIECFFDLARKKRSIKSKLQQACILIIIIALAIYCVLLIFDDLFRMNMDRVLVCATTIIDGIKNLIHTIKVEKKPLPKILFSILSLIYVNYGVVYLFLGGNPTTSFSTVLHGIVFLFCGATNIWLYYRDPKNKQQNDEKNQRLREKTAKFFKK